MDGPELTTADYTADGLHDLQVAAPGSSRLVENKLENYLLRNVDPGCQDAGLTGRQEDGGAVQQTDDADIIKLFSLLDHVIKSIINYRCNSSKNTCCFCISLCSWINCDIRAA